MGGTFASSSFPQNEALSSSNPQEAPEFSLSVPGETEQMQYDLAAWDNEKLDEFLEGYSPRGARGAASATLVPRWLARTLSRLPLISRLPAVRRWVLENDRTIVEPAVKLRGPFVKALYQYEARDGLELSLQEGVVIEVVRKSKARHMYLHTFEGDISRTLISFVFRRFWMVAGQSRSEEGSVPSKLC